MNSDPVVPLLVLTLRLNTSHLQNPSALTRLDIKARFNGSTVVELRCIRWDQSTFRVNIECSEFLGWFNDRLACDVVLG